MRNLLFGNYLPGEDGKIVSGTFSEVPSIDALEKLAKKVEESSSRTKKALGDEVAPPEENADSTVAMLPNRFSLELTSHLNHVFSLPGGHAVIGGRGGVGRRAAARLAAKLSGVRLLEVFQHD